MRTGIEAGKVRGEQVAADNLTPAFLKAVTLCVKSRWPRRELARVNDGRKPAFLIAGMKALCQVVILRGVEQGPDNLVGILIFPQADEAGQNFLKAQKK